jgi:septum formation protein
MTHQDHQLYLASRSPRRRALLDQIGVRFAVLEVHVDESLHPGEHPEDYVLRVALDKARRGHAALPPDDPRPVLGADTAVVVGERILGKPRGREDALEMLGLLSGRTHRVLTALALISPDGERTDLCESRVAFRSLDASEALRYWATGEPRDKAGAYGIQGYGALFVCGLHGSYSGVMGLPLYETGRLLEQVGIQAIPNPASDRARDPASVSYPPIRREPVPSLTIPREPRR